MERHSASPCETLAEQYQALLEVAEAISDHRDLHELCRDLAQRLPRVLRVNFVGLCLHDPGRNVMRLHTLQANSLRLRLNEFEQIGIDLIRIRRRHAVRETLVGFQYRALHQLGAQRAGGSIRDDLVIIAMHDQSRHRELF